MSPELVKSQEKIILILIIIKFNVFIFEKIKLRMVSYVTLKHNDNTGLQYLHKYASK